MKITIRRGRKIGDPGFSSTDVGLELSLECDDELYYDRPQEFAAWFDVQCQTADGLLEAEIKRIYATRPAPVETAAQRDRAQTNGNGYRDNGDLYIEQARSREEPRNGREKPRYEWNRRGDRPDDRDRDRGRDERRGGGRNGGRYGPPRDGKQLFAWARREEENGADGFVKALTKWCEDGRLPTRFDQLTADEVHDAYEAGQDMLAQSGGY